MAIVLNLTEAEANALVVAVLALKDQVTTLEMADLVGVSLATTDLLHKLTDKVLSAVGDCMEVA